MSHRLLAFLIHIKMFRVIQFSRCKPKTDFGSVNRGGDEGDRTPYPLLARQVLSQMSYTPVFRSLRFWVRRHLFEAEPCILPEDEPQN